MLLPPPSTKRLRTEINRAGSEPGDNALAPQVQQTAGSGSPNDVDPIPASDAWMGAAPGAEVATAHSDVTGEVSTAEGLTEASQSQAQAETDGIADEDVDVEFRPLHGKSSHHLP